MCDWSTRRVIEGIAWELMVLMAIPFSSDCGGAASNDLTEIPTCLATGHTSRQRPVAAAGRGGRKNGVRCLRHGKVNLKVSC